MLLLCLCSINTEVSTIRFLLYTEASYFRRIKNSGSLIPEIVPVGPLDSRLPDSHILDEALLRKAKPQIPEIEDGKVSQHEGGSQDRH